MTCSQAREALVVAEVRELRELSDASGDLAAHLGECAECRARADAVASQTATLVSVVRRRSRRRRSRRLVLAASAPIAAALVLAVTLYARRDHGAPDVRLSSLPVVRRVSVTVAQGQAATVVRTADTTVTVVWFTGAGQ